jgi:DNA-binding CsgD family transcriptional regulator
MLTDSQKYSLFLRFVKTYSPIGFKGINPDDPLLIELEEMMEQNNQFFFVGDIIRMTILYTSKRSTHIIGVEPDEITFYHLWEGTHPDNMMRHGLSRAKLFKMAHDLFVTKKEDMLLSTNYKFRNPFGEYANLLFQCYLFFSGIPCNTVYALEIITNIDWFNKIKHGYHYYLGNDLANFRYPDEDLLMKGNIFSDREFEIIKLIHLGYNNKQISEKLFISQLTVKTHRRNILDKTSKSRISDIIYDLEEHALI